MRENGACPAAVNARAAISISRQFSVSSAMDLAPVWNLDQAASASSHFQQEETVPFETIQF
jgi:hypothetical protein